jgi:hypothetical protein
MAKPKSDTAEPTTAAPLTADFDAPSELAKLKAERAADQKQLADMKALMGRVLERQAEVAGPPMCLFQINEAWNHPDTGDRYEANEEISVADSEHLQVNVGWIPLNKRAALKLLPEVKKKNQIKQERKAMFTEYRKEYGSMEDAREEFANELLAQANGHIRDLADLVKALEEYEDGQAEFTGKPRATVAAEAERKSEAQKALDSQYKVYEKKNQRINDKSVAS